jgi:large subunit ribosomal protein L10
MSKVIKQMEMDALKKDFNGVRDLVVLSVRKLSATADQALRATLRKKNIRLRVIKNSLTRKVFGEMGLNVPDDSPYWLGPTTFAWGANSLAELSKAIDGELKGLKTAPLYRDRVAVKGAVADGQVVTYEAALKMPTRAEAIGSVLAALLGAGGAIAGCLVGPASQVASQIQKISEKEPAGEAAPPAGGPGPEAPPAPAG